VANDVTVQQFKQRKCSKWCSQDSCSGVERSIVGCWCLSVDSWLWNCTW